MSYDDYLILLQNFSQDKDAFVYEIQIYFDYILSQAKFYDNTKIDGD